MILQQDLDLSELGMKTVFSEGKTQAGALVLGKSPCLAVKYTRNGDRQVETSSRNVERYLADKVVVLPISGSFSSGRGLGCRYEEA